MGDRELIQPQPETSNFKASSGWVRGFMKRGNLSMRIETTHITPPRTTVLEWYNEGKDSILSGILSEAHDFQGLLLRLHHRHGRNSHLGLHSSSPTSQLQGIQGHLCGSHSSATETSHRYSYCNCGWNPSSSLHLP